MRNCRSRLPIGVHRSIPDGSSTNGTTFTSFGAPISVPQYLSQAGGLKVGVLSNTIWSRQRHEDIFARDGVLELIDGAVYTSEVPWTKPHPEAFLAAMRAVGMSEPARCLFVGDRLFDDVWGAQNVGMRAAHILRDARTIARYW